MLKVDARLGAAAALLTMRVCNGAIRANDRRPQKKMVAAAGAADELVIEKMTSSGIRAAKSPINDGMRRQSARRPPIMLPIVTPRPNRSRIQVTACGDTCATFSRIGVM